jgi:RNA polymerase sigma factor (sigma-70 family)
VFGEVPDRGQHDIAAKVSSDQDLIAALSLLPPRQRAVLVLRYLDDLTEAQTAQALGISLGTVKSTAHRATATLRRLCPDLSTTPTPEGTHS